MNGDNVRHFTVINRIYNIEEKAMQEKREVKYNKKAPHIRHLLLQYYRK